MSKIKQFIKNISPLNNRTEMPIILYIIKVILIFWFVKFGAEIIGEGIIVAISFAYGKNPLRGEMFAPNIMMLMLGGFIFQGAMEEVLCRGIVMQLLMKKTNIFIDEIIPYGI